MGAIDNNNLTNYRANTGTVGFTPGARYTYDASAQEVDVQDLSDFPSGVSHLKTKVTVHDKFGESVSGYILPRGDSDSGFAGDTTIDVSTLNASKGLDITATVIAERTSSGQLVADGSAYNITTSGTLSNWDAQHNS